MRIALILLLSGAVAAQTPAAAPAAQASPCPTAADTRTPQQLLLAVKRIYVDSFGEDPISKQLQSMVISSLMASNRFIVTENRERADAILKGSALEKTSKRCMRTAIRRR
jgi:curli biogenesis system outer membrane secretion channel CsgG